MIQIKQLIFKDVYKCTYVHVTTNEKGHGFEKKQEQFNSTGFRGKRGKENYVTISNINKI